MQTKLKDADLDLICLFWTVIPHNGTSCQAQKYPVKR